MDLQALLPQLLPLASAWAETQSHYILQNGDPLDGRNLKLARGVGVAHPELVRILSVPLIPKPDHPLLAGAAEQLQFLGPDTAGLTLAYGVYIRADCAWDPMLIAHECRHIYQYEQHKSIRSYLELYISDLLKYGYADSPLEVDAEEAAARCVIDG